MALEKLKWRFFLRALHKKNNFKHQSVPKGTEMKRVALLFDGSELDNRQLISKFKTKLEIQGKSVFLFAFIPQRLSVNAFPFEYFQKKDVNWFHVPGGPAVRSFLDMEFDLLINLDIHLHLPVHYLAKKSKARYRVGPLDDRFEFYNLMVNGTYDASLKTYIFELRTILNSIHFYGSE